MTPFTAMFEALVIDWLEETENIAAVAKGMRLSWEEVANIRSRAVARGMKRRGRAALPAGVGVDETSITKGQEYITVVKALSQARKMNEKNCCRRLTGDDYCGAAAAGAGPTVSR